MVDTKYVAKKTTAITNPIVRTFMAPSLDNLPQYGTWTAKKRHHAMSLIFSNLQNGTIPGPRGIHQVS
jgi:hypothetical protein